MNETIDILLVDDTPENLSLILAYCKNTPHRFSSATNGEEALALLKQKRFDLVFMDIQMPVMDGHTAVKLYREWELSQNHEKTFIAALTAFHMEEEKKKCLDAGCDLFITKPVKKITILETIELAKKDRT